MIFDPLYFIILLPALLLSGWASLQVRRKFSKYSDRTIQRGLSGAEVARMIVERSGLSGVNVEMTKGFLSDHYDPRDKTLRLSPDVYQGRSVSSVGVAAHEAGHAIQHAASYKPLMIRTAMVPIASAGSNLAWILILAGMFLGMLGLAKIGVLLFGGMVVFTLVTLPVEFDASNRAKALLTEHGIVTDTELGGVSEVLNAAAMTYVAAALTAILQLLYFMLRLGMLGDD